MPKWPHQSKVSSFYGPVGMNQARLQLPFPMKLAWDKDTVVNKITVHEKVHDSAKRVFDRIADHYTPEQIAPSIL